MNILFVHLPAISVGRIEDAIRTNMPLDNYAFAPPLGILHLASWLRNAGLGDRIALADFAPTVGEVHEYTSTASWIFSVLHMAWFMSSQEDDPDVVAFTLIFSPTHGLFKRAVAVAKQMWPDAKIVAGGAHATNASEAVLAAGADIVFHRESEIDFATFIGSGGVVSDLPEGGVKDLDALPFPAWDFLDVERYVEETTRRAYPGTALEGRRAWVVMTSRGCPFSCTFCSTHTVHGKLLRYHSPEYVRRQIEELQRDYGITDLVFEDDLFTGNRKKCLAILAALRDLDPNLRLHFPNALAVNTLHDDVMDALIETGMRIAHVAVESGSDYVQRNVIKKNVNLARAIEVVRYLQERGVVVRVYFILGFPGETKEQMSETVDFAFELSADWSRFGLAVPLAGTPMYREFVEMGCIDPVDDEALWERGFYQDRAFDTHEVTAEELRQIQYDANLEINFVHNRSAPEVAISLLEGVVRDHPWHVFGWGALSNAYGRAGDEDRSLATMERVHWDLKHGDERSIGLVRDHTPLFEELLQGAVP